MVTCIQPHLESVQVPSGGHEEPEGGGHAHGGGQEHEDGARPGETPEQAAAAEEAAVGAAAGELHVVGVGVVKEVVAGRGRGLAADLVLGHEGVELLALAAELLVVVVVERGGAAAAAAAAAGAARGPGAPRPGVTEAHLSDDNGRLRVKRGHWGKVRSWLLATVLATLFF